MTTQSYKTRIRTLYALSATFTAQNPVLLQGEPATESDTGKKKIGDGVTPWNSLPYESGSGLPNGGNPGDILMKSDYANGDADWQPTLDGGTFF